MDINLKGYKDNCGHQLMGDLIIHNGRRMTERETRMAVNWGIENGYNLGVVDTLESLFDVETFKNSEV